MPTVLESGLAVVLVLATSIWVGGYVTIAVVARVSGAVLEPPERIRLFRSLGRVYFWVGAPALVVALVAGGLLAQDRAGALTAAAIAVATVLLVAFALAVAQARRMTRLRHEAAAAPAGATVHARVAVGARVAGALRGVLGILTLALVVLGSVLAVR